MPFTPKDWRDAPDTSTPITAAALEDMETRLAAYADQVAVNAQTGAYTLVLADVSKAIEVNSATGVTLTIPPNSSVAFAVGTVIEVFQQGAGAITITPGAGVTLRSRGGLLQTAGQYAVIGLRKRATDEWVITGDLA